MSPLTSSSIAIKVIWKKYDNWFPTKNAYTLWKHPTLYSYSHITELLPLAAPERHDSSIFLTMTVQFHSSLLSCQKTPQNVFLTWGPWPLTHDPDLWTCPRYFSTWPAVWISGLYVCLFGRESGNTHTHTHGHTHTCDVKTITPSANMGCKKRLFYWKVWVDLRFVF